jgi:hypothetical protein
LTLSTDNARNRKRGGLRLVPRIRVALLALVALAAVTALAAPAASANSTPPLRSTLAMDLEMFDLHVSTACDKWVFANVSFVEERKIIFEKDGSAREVATVDGRIEWFTRDSGKSYSSKIVNKTVIDYPEGIDLFKPAKITVTVYHGNTFPVGDILPGRGTVAWDGLVYATTDEGIPFYFTEGPPVSMSGGFAASMAETTQRICAALA